MEGIKIKKKPRLKSPLFIAAWPGMGEVAFKAVSLLVEKLSAEEFAQVDPEQFFYQTGSVVKKGLLTLSELPQGKFYYWKNKTGKNDLIIFLSNAQPDLSQAQSYSRKIIKFIKELKVKTVVSFAAMPVPIDHTQKPSIWFTATSERLSESLKSLKFNLLKDGQISGMNGLFLSFAKRSGIDGFCLLGDIPLYTIQIDNPKTSAALLEALGRILGLKIDHSALLQQATVMEEEINKLLEYLKLGGSSAGPIGEEEIEKIKKSLGQLTKLPLSVKDKIDRLFGEAKDDISKAKELKIELDKWNVYKDYEDKFLDLFKKTKGKNN